MNAIAPQQWSGMAPSQVGPNSEQISLAQRAAEIEKYLSEAKAMLHRAEGGLCGPVAAQLVRGEPATTPDMAGLRPTLERLDVLARDLMQMAGNVARQIGG